MKKEKIIKIITPPVASTSVELDLVKLTEHLVKNKKCEWVGGILGGEFGYGCHFRNETFEMRPYYWGECDCGWSERESEWVSGHQHKKDCFSVRLTKFEEKLKKEMDWLGNEYIKRVDEWAKKNGYKDGWRGCASYCDCGYEKDWRRWFIKNKLGLEGHSSECSIQLPNFKHYKSGLEIRWYKWIGRDTEFSTTLTTREWKKIFRECIKSISKLR